MREIKFRVWNTAAKAFYPREHFALDMDGVELQKMPECEHYSEVFIHNPSGQDSMVFMQFTGLLDKNGVEIYEGDIVEYSLAHNNGQTRKGFGEIIFDDYFYQYIIRNSNKDSYPIIQEFVSTEIKKIGDIYQNSELLK